MTLCQRERGYVVTVTWVGRGIVDTLDEAWAWLRERGYETAAEALKLTPPGRPMTITQMDGKSITVAKIGDPLWPR